MARLARAHPVFRVRPQGLARGSAPLRFLGFFRASATARGLVSYDDRRVTAEVGERGRVDAGRESSEAPQVAPVLGLVLVGAVRRLELRVHQLRVAVRELAPERFVFAPELADRANQSGTDAAGYREPPRPKSIPPHVATYGGPRAAVARGEGEGDTSALERR